MRRIALVLAIATLASLIAIGPAGAQANGSIAGTVATPGQVGPWGINVAAVNVVTGATAATTSANQSTGQYTMSVPPGTYAVWFVPVGNLTFAPAVSLYHNASSYDAATPVVVTEGATTTLLHQAAQPAGRISGTITDADGRAVGGCFVAVLTRTPTPTLVGAATSDFTGGYSISSVPIGQMNVLAVCGTGFATTYHGNTTDLTQAVPVTVTSQTGSGASIVAVRTPRSVAGRLTVSGGSDASDACASAYSADGQLLGSSGLHTGGGWAIADLPVGDVRIKFEGCAGSNTNYAPEWYDDAADLASAAPVPVLSDAATTQIDAVITRYGGLSFNFTDPGGNPVNGVCIWLTDSAATRLVTAQYAGTPSASIDQLIPGDYSVLFTDCGSNGFAPEWYQDAPDHAGSTPLTVEEANTHFFGVVLG